MTEIRYAKEGHEHSVCTDHADNLARLLRETGFEIVSVHPVVLNNAHAPHIYAEAQTAAGVAVAPRFDLRDRVVSTQGRRLTFSLPISGRVAAESPAGLPCTVGRVELFTAATGQDRAADAPAMLNFPLVLMVPEDAGMITVLFRLEQIRGFGDRGRSDPFYNPFAKGEGGEP